MNFNELRFECTVASRHCIPHEAFSTHLRSEWTAMMVQCRPYFKKESSPGGKNRASYISLKFTGFRRYCTVAECTVASRYCMAQLKRICIQLSVSNTWVIRMWFMGKLPHSLWIFASWSIWEVSQHSIHLEMTSVAFQDAKDGMLSIDVLPVISPVIDKKL